MVLVGNAWGVWDVVTDSGCTTTGLQLVAMSIRITLNPRIVCLFHDFIYLMSNPFLLTQSAELVEVILCRLYSSIINPILLAHQVLIKLLDVDETRKNDSSQSSIKFANNTPMVTPQRFQSDFLETYKVEGALSLGILDSRFLFNNPRKKTSSWIMCSKVSRIVP